jgi:hypothetical protein
MWTCDCDRTGPVAVLSPSSPRHRHVGIGSPTNQSDRIRYVVRSLQQSARGIGRGFEFGHSWQGAISMAKKKKKAAKKVAKKKGKK